MNAVRRPIVTYGRNTSRLQTVRPDITYGRLGPISCACYAAEGRRFALGQENGVVSTFNDSMEEEQLAGPCGSSVLRMAFDRYGRIACAFSDGAIHVLPEVDKLSAFLVLNGRYPVENHL